jgi:stage II sporulation protein E
MTVDLHKQSIFWKNKLIETRMLVGEQLKGVAHTLTHLIQDVEEDISFNRHLEKQIKEEIQTEGIKVKEVIALEYKDRRQSIDVYTMPCKQRTNIEEMISHSIEKVLGCKVKVEKHVCSHGECYFKCVEEKIYQVSAGAASCAKGQVLGDSYSFMELENGQYLLALADGMGYGQSAYEESSCTIDLLEEFMASGFEKDTAVQLINTMLLICSGDETFSTIDMTFIDRFTGVAEFLKAGAATSFILRDNQITTIRANTLPVGMLKEVDIERQQVKLRDGDIVVMVTDGLLSNKQDVLGKEDTFKHFIKEVSTGEPVYIANYLLQRSKDLLGLDEQDDMTVVVAKIWCKV